MSLSLSRREKILLLVMVVIVGFAAYYYWLYQPLVEETQALELEKNRLGRQLFIEMAMAQRVPEMRELYDSVRHIEREIDFLNLTAEDFLELIQEISKNSNAELVAFFPNETADHLRLNITMIGNYEDIYRFLSGLKRLASQIDVNYLNLRVDGEKLKMDMRLTRQNHEAYRYEEGGEPL